MQMQLVQVQLMVYKMNHFYVYAHIDPTTKEVRYIGKGFGKRAFKLKTCSRYGHHKNWIISLNNKGLNPEVLIIDDRLSEQKALELEVWYIKHMRELGYNLTNLTDGGQGLSNPSLEVREKISANARSRPRKSGYHLSNEWKDNIGKAQLGKLNHMYRKPAHNRRKILGINLETRESKEFNNSQEAADFTNIKSRSNISAICRKKYGYNTANGWTFSYTKENK